MPLHLTKLFLGEHVDDSFPFRQLGILGTSYRSVAQNGNLLRISPNTRQQYVACASR
jgi:hypothetical protein